MAKKIQGLLLVCFLILAALPPADAVIVGPSLKSKHGMVVAANPLAAKVGAEILEKGGNAVDAAIAVSFALGVVEPYPASIGWERRYGFSNIWPTAMGPRRVRSF